MRAFPLALPCLLLAALTVSSCSTPTMPSRNGKLLTMAAEEAGFIHNLTDRLTRQLNIADLQIQAGQKSEALRTLAAGDRDAECGGDRHHYAGGGVRRKRRLTISAASLVGPAWRNFRMEPAMIRPPWMRT